jgi:hypothetical protein
MKARTWIAAAGPACALLAMCAAVALDGCGTKKAAALPAKITLFVSGDSRGYLEPCGCRRDQAGGLPGRATVINTKKPDERVVLDVGNMTPGSRPYDLLKLRYLTQGMAKIGYDAVNLGKTDAELDLDALRKAMAESPLPYVSANIVAKNGGAPVAEPYRIISRGGLRIGVTGVASVDERDAGPGVLARPPLEALSGVISALKGKCDYLVVLAFVDEETIRRIAEQFPEVMLVLGGDVPQSSSSAQEVNRANVFSVTDRGKVLGEIDLEHGETGYHVAAVRATKIVGEKLAKDPAMVELIGRFKDELRDRRYELASAEGLERIGGQDGTADEFVGQQACIACHADAHRATQSSAHQHAFATLIARKSEYDPECLRCHTVGYGLNSGFVDQQKTPHLANVQCESCHGRGKNHVAAMQAGRRGASTLKAVTAASCIQCHDTENSENFHFLTFWPKIRH